MFWMGFAAGALTVSGLVAALVCYTAVVVGARAARELGGGE